MKTQIVLVALAVSFVSGCAAPGRYLSETAAVDTAGAYQLVPRADFEDIDLVRLLDPHGAAEKALTPEKWKLLSQGQRIDAAFQQFHDIHRSKGDERKARDQIQERVLAASTQRCNAFKGSLQRQFSRNNFVLGLGATISGVIGAVVPGVQASKNLAAAAGIFSGARAEWNQDFLSNIAVNVIIDGVEQRQQEVYRQIVIAGQGKDIETYNVEAAIKDALFYHGQCSIMTGLRVASDAIKFANDPGIDAATRILLKLNNAKKVSDGATDVDFQLSSKIEQLSLNQRLFAGTPRDSGADSRSLLRAIFSAKQKVTNSAEAVRAALEKIEISKGTDTQNAIIAKRDALRTSISGCDSAASKLTIEIAEIQAQMDNTISEADKVTLPSALEAKSKLSAAIANAVNFIESDFSFLAESLRVQIDTKAIKPLDAKKRIDAISPSAPSLCNP